MHQWARTHAHTYTHREKVTHMSYTLTLVMGWRRWNQINIIPLQHFLTSITLYSSSGTPMVDTSSWYLSNNHTLHISKKKKKGQVGLVYSHKIFQVLSGDWLHAEAGLVFKSYFSFSNDKRSTLKAFHSGSTVTTRHWVLEEQNHPQPTLNKHHLLSEACVWVTGHHKLIIECLAGWLWTSGHQGGEGGGVEGRLQHSKENAWSHASCSAKMFGSGDSKPD